MEDPVELRATALVEAPAGCAFLSIAVNYNLPVESIVEPTMSFFLAGRALDEVTIWRADHDEAVREYLRLGQRFQSLARSLVSHPSAAWWFEPLQKDNQLMALKEGEILRPQKTPLPNRIPSRAELRSQQPSWALYTSTAFNGISSHLISSFECIGDLGPLRPPIGRYLLSTSPASRIYEIDGPMAWNRLCVAYPAVELGGPEGNVLTPNFSQVAQDWDGVHLSLGGLLTGEQVAISNEGRLTALQSWSAEQTAWLKWSFSGFERLEDIRSPIRAPKVLR